MTVKEILKLAIEFVGEKELAIKLDTEEELSEKETEKMKTMLSCFNLVNQEIAGEYLPFLTREDVDVMSGKIFFSDLSKTVINIYEVKDKFGFNLPFKVISNCVEVKRKPKSVIYSFLPEMLTLDDEVEFFNGLSARVYAYGIASEFLLQSGLGDDAEIWEERYKESLFILSRKRGEHRLPKRSWL